MGESARSDPRPDVHGGLYAMKQTNLFEEITVDGFCGGGGWSTGFELGICRPVDIGINHDAAAITSVLCIEQVDCMEGGS